MLRSLLPAPKGRRSHSYRSEDMKSRTVRNCLTLTMKEPPSLETSETVHPAAQHHIPEDLTLQRRRRENHKSLFFF